MADLAMEIERIVREVLAALPSPLAASSVPAPAGSEAGPEKKNDKTEDRTEVVLHHRLISLADLPERMAGVRRLVVPPRAVVTPAVRDELQRKNIALAFGEVETAGTKVRFKVNMVAMGSKLDPGPLAKSLESEGYEVAIDRMQCLIAANEKLASALSAGKTLAVLLSRHTSAAICLANRHAGVRAILGTRADAVEADAAAVGANLLVVDPVAHGFFVTRQMAIRFLRGGPASAPRCSGKNWDRKGQGQLVGWTLVRLGGLKSTLRRECLIHRRSCESEKSSARLRSTASTPVFWERGSSLPCRYRWTTCAQRAGRQPRRSRCTTTWVRASEAVSPLVRDMRQPCRSIRA